jgi:hypothetical protein
MVLLMSRNRQIRKTRRQRMGLMRLCPLRGLTGALVTAIISFSVVDPS